MGCEKAFHVYALHRLKDWVTFFKSLFFVLFFYFWKTASSVNLHLDLFHCFLASNIPVKNASNFKKCVVLFALTWCQLELLLFLFFASCFFTWYVLCTFCTQAVCRPPLCSSASLEVQSYWLDRGKKIEQNVMFDLFEVLLHSLCFKWCLMTQKTKTQFACLVILSAYQWLIRVDSLASLIRFTLLCRLFF